MGKPASVFASAASAVVPPPSLSLASVGPASTPGPLPPLAPPPPVAFAPPCAEPPCVVVLAPLARVLTPPVPPLPPEPCVPPAEGELSEHAATAKTPASAARNLQESIVKASLERAIFAGRSSTSHHQVSPVSGIVPPAPNVTAGTPKRFNKAMKRSACTALL